MIMFLRPLTEKRKRILIDIFAWVFFFFVLYVVALVFFFTRLYSFYSFVDPCGAAEHYGEYLINSDSPYIFLVLLGTIVATVLFILSFRRNFLVGKSLGRYFFIRLIISISAGFILGYFACEIDTHLMWIQDSFDCLAQ